MAISSPHDYVFKRSNTTKIATFDCYISFYAQLQYFVVLVWLSHWPAHVYISRDWFCDTFDDDIASHSIYIARHFGSFKDLFETLKRLFRKGGTMIHKLVKNIYPKALNIKYLFYFFKTVISSFLEVESMDMKR